MSTKELFKNLTADEKEEYFVYLDDLRESGVTNMFGAAQYVEAAFSIPYDLAREILSEWMQTFTERQLLKGERND